MNNEIYKVSDQSLEPWQVCLIEKHCAYLTQACISQHLNFEAFSSETFIKLYQKYPAPSFEISSLEEGFDSIKKTRKLTQFPYFTFFCAISKVAPSQINTAKYLHINIINAAFVLRGLKGYKELITRAMDNTRRLFTNKIYLPLLEKIPENPRLFASDFEALLDKKVVGEHIVRSLILLFDKLEQKAPVYKKRSFKPSVYRPNPQIKPDYISNDSPIKFDLDEPIYKEILVSSSDEKDSEIELAETIADEKTDRKYLELNLIQPADVQKSLRLQSKLASHVAASIHKREKQLSCEFRNLTKHEISTLTTVCYEKLKANNEYGYLMMSLLLGRTIGELFDEIDNFTIGKHDLFAGLAVLRFGPTLPKHKVEHKLEKLLNRPEGEVLLSLPQFLTSVVEKFKNIVAAKKFEQERVKDLVSTAIKSINRSHGTRITEARIANNMTQWLSKEGTDSAEIAFMRSKSVDQEPGCFYYQMRVQKLIDLHLSYVNSTCSTLKQYQYDLPKKTELTVGSELYPRPNQLTKLFRLLQKDLHEYKRLRKENSNEFHNRFTLYLLLILNLSTGHRPVSQPFHSIRCFDTNAGTVYLSDKENRSSQSARTIKLPKFANDQLQVYLEYLKAFKHQIRNVAPSNYDLICGTLAGSGPLFYFFVDYKLESVTPRIVSDIFKDIYPLPLNWHRHFLKTWLCNSGIHPYCNIDAFMGHIGGGGDPFSRFSGIAMADLSAIADEIDDLLRNVLGLQIIDHFGDFHG